MFFVAKAALCPYILLDRNLCNVRIIVMKEPEINKVDRNVAKITNNSKDEVFVNAPASQLVGFVWQLTAEIFSLRGIDAQQRLQRNVANLNRQRD